ncbi:MAG: ParB/RepB/Spo0J family partition protein [Bacilli bacterium]
MKEQNQKMKLPKLDDLFTNQAQRDYENAEKVEIVPIELIDDNPNNPYHVNRDEKMQEMAESIKQYGVLEPIIIRPKENGRYELVAGHRRKIASIIAGEKVIRCTIKDLTDDEATILMVDSNIQREEILPSERAFAFKLKLEALNHQGKKLDGTTLSPLDTKLDSAQIIANENNESRAQIFRYIRLTYLIPELLEEVDNKRIAFRPAVELSYLEEDYQYVILNKLQYDEVSPSLSQAITLKKMQQEGTISEEKIENLLDKEKPNQKEFIKIHNERIEKYIPTKIKESGKVEDFIIQCVEEHNKREKLRQERNVR